MKRWGIYAIIVACAILMSGMASALCDLNAILLNQDPYPATPGGYVKVVFQVNGTENPECGKLAFDIVPNYPFFLDSNATKTVMEGGNFIKGYPSSVQVGYNIRVDQDAVDGDNKIQLKFGRLEDSQNAYKTQDFYINVEDARTDFDVSIQDYSQATNTITFAVVNIGKKDAEALTLEIPEQGNVKLAGNNKIVIGSLNKNDDTTANIKATPRGEGDLTIKLSYNDKNGVRRTIEKKVFFSGNYLQQVTITAAKGLYYYLFWAVIVLAILYFAYGYYKKAKAKNSKLMLLRKRA